MLAAKPLMPTYTAPVALVADEEVAVTGELVRNEADGFVGGHQHREHGACGEVLHLRLPSGASGQHKHLRPGAAWGHSVRDSAEALLRSQAYVLGLDVDSINCADQDTGCCAEEAPSVARRQATCEPCVYASAQPIKLLLSLPLRQHEQNKTNNPVQGTSSRTLQPSSA